MSFIGQNLRWGVGTLVWKTTASLVGRAKSAGKGFARIIWVVQNRTAVNAGMRFTWGDWAAHRERSRRAQVNICWSVHSGHVCGVAPLWLQMNFPLEVIFFMMLAVRNVQYSTDSWLASQD